MNGIKECFDYELASGKETVANTILIADLNTHTLDLIAVWCDPETISVVPEENGSIIAELSYSDYASYYGIGFESVCADTKEYM